MQTPPDNQFYFNIMLAAESQLLRPLIHSQLMPGVPENNKENTRRWIKLKYFIRSQQVKSPGQLQAAECHCQLIPELVQMKVLSVYKLLTVFLKYGCFPPILNKLFSKIQVRIYELAFNLVTDSRLSSPPHINYGMQRDVMSKECSVTVASRTMSDFLGT